MSDKPILTIITDSHYFDHDTGGMDHPESPVRLEVIIDALHKSDYLKQLDFISASPATREQLQAAHEESWLFRFEEAVLSGRSHIDHFDNQICYDSYNVAILAAGAGLKGIDLIEQGSHTNVFCLVRPPGHHAEKGTPYGFCFYNNVVVATRYWQEQYKKQRVVVFDFDAHHGNGIQSGLEQESGSLYISVHEHPSFSYPGTGYKDESGIGEGKDSIINIPLSPGARDNDVLKALKSKVEPVLERFQPDCFIIAAGFDGHEKDDMSGLGYSTELYNELGQLVAGWANRYTDGCLLSILEGGYELSVLGESVEAYVAGLLNVNDKNK